MGLLTVGKPLSLPDSKQYIQYVRDHGLRQFLNTWKRVKGLENDELRWGDEIECGVLKVDPVAKTVKISLRSAEIRALLSENEKFVQHQSEGCTWHPEFGAWMVESTPSRPYTNYASDMLRVEKNMIIRRRRLLSALAEDEIAPTVTSFPLLGVGNFYHPRLDGEEESQIVAPFSQSSLIPDHAINPHPRFAALVENIRLRRAELGKVEITVPLFRDEFTPEFGLSSEDGTAQTGLEPDTNIHMDCMAFGMGMCCLQVTFQARDVDESRYMFDQLTVLAPIMLAITAATPIFKGRLADVDARWNAIAQSVDDRTAAERGQIDDSEVAGHFQEGLVGGAVKRLYKSRYDSISTYIYHCQGHPPEVSTSRPYNDIPCPIDEATKALLREEGVDEDLAQHVAHLFTRDPLVIFEDHIYLDDEKSMDHWENIQSTNWQTVRWKPPPPRITPEDPHIGWRTEFRSMEVQLTDFENAAFTVFVVLLTRVVLAFDLQLYIPISRVDENMQRAQQRDAVNTQKFFFREVLAPPEEDTVEEETASAGGSVYVSDQLNGSGSAIASDGFSSSTPDSLPPQSLRRTPSWTSLREEITEPAVLPTRCAFELPEDEVRNCYEEMSIDQIFNGTGKDSYYPGLIPLVDAYLYYINCDAETYSRVKLYLDFISKRASGELMTPASWIRGFVHRHPAYRGDSIISDEVAYDLMMACKGIGEGSIPAPELFGNDVVIERVRAEDAYGQVLPGRLNASERSDLLKTLMHRAYNPRPKHVARGTLRSRSLSSSFTEREGSVATASTIAAAVSVSASEAISSSVPNSDA